MASFRRAARGSLLRGLLSRPTRRRAGARSRPAVAAIERLEDRTLPTVYFVTTAIDTVASDGFVSLREAVRAASTNAAVNEAAAGSGTAIDSIFFNLGDAAATHTITLGGTELPVAGALTINGFAANRLAISGNGASRVFNVAEGANVTLSGLTVTGGKVTAPLANGGGVLNAGVLTLDRCAIVGNAAAANGGGVASGGLSSSLNLQDCTISRNSAVGGGGGLLFQASGNGSLIFNSTIADNAAAASGGGLFGDATVTLRNVTLFGNRADSDGNASGSGGGIFAAAGSEVLLHNTLVAGNRRGSGAAATSSDVDGILQSPSSHNLIGDAGTAGGLTDVANGNIVGADLATLVDPALRANGGPTKTLALLPNSEAIDAGDNGEIRTLTVEGFDQRGEGFPRSLQARVDIGAFEAAPAANLVGYTSGQWFVGASTGTAFANALWATVPNAAYDALGEADFTGDGKADVFTLLDGVWRVGTSNGTSFTFRPWRAWTNADWRDVKTADLNKDGKADVLARLGGQWWASLSNGTTFDAPVLWTTWAVTDWREFFTADVTGDGRADLIGYVHGQWWVGVSNGATFDPPKLFATWSDAPWQKLLVLEIDGNPSSDVAGFLAGEWWVGQAQGNFKFFTQRVSRWANVPYADLLAGDFNGDGKDDLIGRNAGNWFVGLSNSAITVFTFAPPKLFASWSNVAWKDVRVADFDGDGRDDVAGRFNGQWFVAESNGADGSLAATALWTSWAEVAWQAVAGVDVTGPHPPAAGAPVAGEASLASAPAAVAFRPDDEPLAAFWIKSRDDEELDAGLLAAA